MQLNYAKTDAIVVSTLAEAYYVIDSHLVTSGKLKDVLFGFPVSPDRFDDIYVLSQRVEKFCIFIGMQFWSKNNCKYKFHFMLDHSQTLDALEVYCEQKFNNLPPIKLNVYMKVECGYG